MSEQKTLTIKSVDHIGIRVTDEQRALDFYKVLGFELLHKVEFDAVDIIKNAAGVEINLILNGVERTDGPNVLMDVAEKYTGYTHVALHVESIADTLTVLKDNDIRITQGPVEFGGGGSVSVFIRDPDDNVIELRGRDQDLSAIGEVTFYDPDDRPDPQ
jgi:lactoylglutathione lyase